MTKQPNKNYLSLPPAAVPLIKRTAAFLSIFILFSGIIGPRIIGNGLVNIDGFQIYGGAGKALLFGGIALLLLINKKGYSVELKRWQQSQAIWLVLALFSMIGAFLSVGSLINQANDLLSTVLMTHALILIGVALALVGVFGISNLRSLYKTYKTELTIAVVLSIVFYGFLTAVYALWKPLSSIVLHAVRWLLSLGGLSVTVLQPRTLILSKFAVEVAQFCSGIESIALFTALYVLIAILDWQKFNHKKLYLAFPAALLILFGFNILRVYVLILGGYYINPQIAFSLFHTYAGMVFFIIYSGIFWGVIYKWMLKR